MRQSLLFGKTLRELQSDEVSVNAKLLLRGGFIDKLMSGSYTYLPLGLAVLQNIAALIRQEMNAIGGQEVLMPALHPKEAWEQTGRWKDPGREVMFQFSGRGDRQYGLGWTHEEIITPLAKKFVSSYKDLPLKLYQIQTKFRDEPRAKSGLLRGREFMMKDLYSFHGSETDLDEFYERAKGAYLKIFKRAGLEAILTEASGGAFSQYSHEFQVATPAGEDIVITCAGCDYAQNREIAKQKSGDACTRCKGEIQAQRAIEVGNIFKLKTRFTEAVRFTYRGEDGTSNPVLMGCYGIGLGRVMGAIVEVHHDERGILWPEAVAPFSAHLLRLQRDRRLGKTADALYASLQKSGFSVLYDDREESSIGEKLADADLIGIPLRLVISEKTLEKNQIEVKLRGEPAAALMPEKDLIKYLKTVLGRV
ncbi:hypothetical protein HYW17_04820 [Candidatus Uhrbacteria bacterium]|nr:hypothetical protein [Candidatus Uhrbacteria bacterium]